MGQLVPGKSCYSCFVTRFLVSELNFQAERWAWSDVVGDALLDGIEAAGQFGLAGGVSAAMMGTKRRS
jgi:hypothetical protein